MPSEKSLVYLVLGAAGSGRREVLADLIEGGLGEGDRVAVMLAEGEAAAAAEARLGAVTRWRWTEENTIEGSLPAEAGRIFLVTDGRRNPVDQLEAFGPWLAAQGGELGRVICVVDCQLAEKNPPLLAWFDACVQFSDVVLLNRREGVANKWLSDFQARYRDQYIPCLFEFVKGGRVKNPALVLEPQARRMSHVFDEEQDWVVTGADGEELDEEDLDGEEGEEEIEAAPEVEPYFARDAAGRRVKRLPDIAKFL
ncbi:MAG: hypothetical protein HZA93_06245 [Verrucomicrobia bacterium]|nr:hypothetical protein [Verrucomicrobiota bacterium]